MRNAAGNVAGLDAAPGDGDGGDPGLATTASAIIRSLVVSAARVGGDRADHGHARPAVRRRRASAGGRRDGRRSPPRCTAPWASTDVELEAIREKLGREPNDLELAMFSVMWSEHCSYKSSRPLLADAARPRARTSSPGVGEQAGVIAIGDGLAVAFKIE